MSHNVKFSSLSYQTALICSSETFALITVIDRLEGRTGRAACNCVVSSHRNK